MGGALLGTQGWKEPVEMARSTFGGSMMPWDAESLLGEMENMETQLELIASGAYQFRNMLREHPKVKNVYYPEEHSGKDLRMGGFVTVEIDISLMDVPRFIDGLTLFQKGVFWGGSVPVVTPLLASYRIEVLKEWGLSPGLIRFYTGTANPKQLYSDVVNALESL